jgi:AraC family transcriptional regulator
MRGGHPIETVSKQINLTQNNSTPSNEFLPATEGAKTPGIATHPIRVPWSLDQCSPHVVMLSRHHSRNRKGITPDDRKTPARRVDLYEIEFFTQTGGVAVIDQHEYPIRYGDIRFHRPGQIVWSHMHYACYAMRLTLDGTIPDDNHIQPHFANRFLDQIPSFLTAKSPGKYMSLFNEILRLWINPRPASELLLKSKVLELLYMIYQDAVILHQHRGSPRVTDTITRAMEYIKQHYAEPVKLDDIASAVNLSPFHFHRLFKRSVTMTPLAYMTRIRIERARELLLTTQMPISEIAPACGYENSSYFAKVFLSYTGQTPGVFRQNGQEY